MIWTSIWCVNEVAKILEIPFGMDINAINLEDLHAEFVGGIAEAPDALKVQQLVRDRAFEEKERSQFTRDTPFTISNQLPSQSVIPVTADQRLQNTAVGLAPDALK